MNKEPIVHKLKRYLRDKGINHQEIALKTDKHRTFITRKLNGDSMESRLLEQIMDAAGIWYHDLVCKEDLSNLNLEKELYSLKEEVNLIKETLAEYKTKN
ncbi:MAG: hypothetical protein MRZ79_13530 [Bacteroidia bacterium]|nr:hypothetical protein [Bacteroidia bacterium]